MNSHHSVAADGLTTRWNRVRGSLNAGLMGLTAAGSMGFGWLLLVVVTVWVSMWPVELRAEARPVPAPYIHLKVVAGPSPFAASAYGLRRMDGFALVTQAKAYPHVQVDEYRARLVETGVFDKVCAALEVMNLEEINGKGDSFWWTPDWHLSVDCNGKKYEVDIKGTESLPGRKGGDAIAAVIGPVEQASGPVYFRDLVIRGSEMGAVNIRTVPSTWVEVDGILVGTPTPVFGYQLKSGPHSALFRDKEGRLLRKITFTVKPGEDIDINIDFGTGLNPDK